MTELKTLKDLKHPELRLRYLNKKKLISIIELRQEAIKWIKEFDKTTEVKNITNLGSQVTIWIKHFFNITEEEKFEDHSLDDAREELMREKAEEDLK